MQACIATNTRRRNQLLDLEAIARGTLFQEKFGIAVRAKDGVLKRRRLRVEEAGSGALGGEQRIGNA